MRYVVVGAGAVGGTIGGRLAQHGHEVALAARGAHARALREHGLRLDTPAESLVLRVPTVEGPAALRLRSDDVLVLTVKSQDTAGVLDILAGLPVDGVSAAEVLPLVCAQNGVENERVALRRFARVYGVCVVLPASHLEPGRVAAQGHPLSGMLDLGRYPAGVDSVVRVVAADLVASGFASQPEPAIMRWKYAKLLRNLANALEAMCGEQDWTGLEALARAEGEDCLAAAGIDVASDDEWRGRRGLQVEIAPVSGEERTGGSTWQSLAKGSSTVECDYLNGEVALLGRRYGVPTPVNSLLQTRSSAFARARRPAGSLAVAELERDLARGRADAIEAAGS